MATLVTASTAAGNPQFTCLSCSIAFLTADDQREHYKSDHHRYNMKRRVAGLPPITPAAFNQKVLERRAETALTVSSKERTCDVCNKVYITENSYRSHVNSKRHRDAEVKAAMKRALFPSSNADPEGSNEPTQEPEVPPSKPALPTVLPAAAPEAEEAKEDEEDDDEVTQTIEEKIAASRNNRLTPSSCLFCPTTSTSPELNLDHMLSAHGFFIPDFEYLVDLPGLLTYLGEKVAVGNVCLYCNGKGRELKSIEAVRKHMVDKSHCKIAYDSQKDQLEISDYYDFTSSYPADKKKSKAKKSSKKVPAAASLEDDEWEDANDDVDGEVDEVVEIEGSEDGDEDGSEDEVDEDGITYGDTQYELVLPSGARIGHRSMRRYYVQNFRGRGNAEQGNNSGAALVRRLIEDSKSEALVPTKGGFGAFGSGMEVVKARNRGEAKEAGRHIREFRDQQRKEQFRTKVGFVHNSQKHYRDPLLQ